MDQIDQLRDTSPSETVDWQVFPDASQETTTKSRQIILLPDGTSVSILGTSEQPAAFSQQVSEVSPLVGYGEHTVACRTGALDAQNAKLYLTVESGSQFVISGRDSEVAIQLGKGSTLVNDGVVKSVGAETNTLQILIGDTKAHENGRRQPDTILRTSHRFNLGPVDVSQIDLQQAPTNFENWGAAYFFHQDRLCVAVALTPANTHNYLSGRRRQATQTSILAHAIFFYADHDEQTGQWSDPHLLKVVPREGLPELR